MARKKDYRVMGSPLRSVPTLLGHLGLFAQPPKPAGFMLKPPSPEGLLVLVSSGVEMSSKPSVGQANPAPRWPLPG